MLPVNGGDVETVVKHFSEKMNIIFVGTLFDLETTGDWNRQFRNSDTRRYAQLRPTIFGYITGNELIQYCAEGHSDIPNVVSKMNELLPTFSPPFYALNCHFERGVFTHSCTFIPEPLIDVRGENNFERKWDARKRLGIPTYDDPFNGVGYKCMTEWEKGNYSDCMKHNRACLQIERDILLKLKSVRA